MLDNKEINIKEEEFEKMLILLSSLIKQNEEMLNTMRDNEKIDRELYLSSIETIERMTHKAKSMYAHTNAVMYKITGLVIIALILIIYINH